MATLAEIRDSILEKLDDGQVVRPNASQVDRQINSTIDYYEDDAFWFTENIATIPTVVGDRALAPLPTDFKSFIEPNGLVLNQSGIIYPLQKVSPLKYDTLDTGASGRPQWWTYRDDGVELYYIPDQVYDINIFYRVQFADLVNDGDSNAFTDNAARLVEYRTLGDLLLDYREDTERGNFYLQRAKEELKQVKRESYDRTATGSLITESLPGTGSYYYWTVRR